MSTKRAHKPLPACPRTWTVAQRLTHYTRIDPVSGCHIWQASTRDTGYGQIHLHGRNLLAHRVAWTNRHGSIPKGMNLCHRCDERRCINPDHLFVASQSANMMDHSQKKRAQRRLAVRDRQIDDDVAMVRLYYRGVHMKGELSVEPFDPDAVLRKPTNALPRKLRSTVVPSRRFAALAAKAALAKRSRGTSFRGTKSRQSRLARPKRRIHHYG